MPSRDRRRKLRIREAVRQHRDRSASTSSGSTVDNGDPKRPLQDEIVSADAFLRQPNTVLPLGRDDAVFPLESNDAGFPLESTGAAFPSGIVDAVFPCERNDAAFPVEGNDAVCPSGIDDAAFPSGREDGVGAMEDEPCSESSVFSFEQLMESGSVAESIGTLSNSFADLLSPTSPAPKRGRKPKNARTSGALKARQAGPPNAEPPLRESQLLMPPPPLPPVGKKRGRPAKSERAAPTTRPSNDGDARVAATSQPTSRISTSWLSSVDDAVIRMYTPVQKTMPKGLKLSEYEKGQIRALRDQQLSFRKIASGIGRSPFVVINYLKDPEAYGTVKSSGRPKLTDARTRRRIVNVASNSTVSSSQIVSDLGLNCSPITVRRVLHDSGVIVRGKMLKCPNLSQRHKTARLEFAEEKLAQQLDFSKIVWSDEKKFNLDGPDGFCGYWHDLRKEPRYFSKRNFGGGNVMVWGAFEAAGTLPLAFTSNRMDSDEYQHVLQEHLTPYWQPDYLFMQDNASIHRSAVTMAYLAENEINVFPWPACSPDLNPIENLWGILVRDVYRNNRQYSSVNELKTEILAAWSRLSLVTLNNLARSLPKRLIEVVKNRGGATK